MRPDFIADRLIALQEFINQVLMNPILASSLPTKKFIDPDSYSTPFHGAFLRSYRNGWRYLQLTYSFHRSRSAICVNVLTHGRRLYTGSIFGSNRMAVEEALFQSSAQTARKQTLAGTFQHQTSFNKIKFAIARQTAHNSGLCNNINREGLQYERKWKRRLDLDVD